MTSSSNDFSAAFFAAATVPALLTGLYLFLAFGPGGLLFGFSIALVVATLHVLVLAVPIHAMLSRRGTPGPVLVLAFSFLIGALPLPLLWGVEDLATGFCIFGFLGMSGGVAFLLASVSRTDDRER